MDPLQQVFVENVRTRMKARRWSRNKLADFSGISRSGLTPILNGRVSPSLRIMGLIADALGVSVLGLLKENG